MKKYSENIIFIFTNYPPFVIASFLFLVTYFPAFLPHGPDVRTLLSQNHISFADLCSMEFFLAHFTHERMWVWRLSDSSTGLSWCKWASEGLHKSDKWIVCFLFWIAKCLENKSSHGKRHSSTALTHSLQMTNCQYNSMNKNAVFMKIANGIHTRVQLYFSKAQSPQGN